MGRNAEAGGPGSNSPSEARPEGLTELVRRTDGLQPWRRVFHMSSGLALAALGAVVGPDRASLSWILGGALLLAASLDGVRLRHPRVNEWFFRTLMGLASPREARGVASSTWYLVGLLVVQLWFPASAWIPAVLVLALADPAAGVVGRLWGQRKIGAGTLEGSATFFAVSFAVLLAFATPTVALVAAAWVTVWEATPLPVDDNLIVPVATALAMTLL